MEALRRILKLLGIIKDRRLKEIQNDQNCFTTCSAEELQAWQDFVAWIDLLEASPDNPARRLLAEILLPCGSISERLLFFQSRQRARDDWADILRFADLPIQFGQNTFEALNAEFARAGTIKDQIAIINSFFSTADPTHAEMLLLLIEGKADRRMPPQTKQAAELFERETAVRDRLKSLLDGELSDILRWWLIRSVNSAVGASQIFLRDTVKNRRDLRLQCMLMPILLKTGFEWASRSEGQTADFTESMQSHMYANRIARLAELIEPA